MAVEISITEEFNKLCAGFVPEKKRVSLGKPVQSRSEIRRHLKRTVYTALFKYLDNKERSSHDSGRNLQEEVKSELGLTVWGLRWEHQYDEANTLEAHLNTVHGIVEETGSDTLFHVLRVLLLLKDTGPHNARDVLGYGKQNLPVVPKRSDAPWLPKGPLCYGDTHLIEPGRFHYMHYPRQLFEAEPLGTVSHITHVCEQLPGTGLAGGVFFSVHGALGDKHEHSTTMSLFGGLVHGRVDSLDVRLALPELPDDPSMMETRIPQTFSSYSLNQSDEGFKSQEGSMSGSTQEDGAGSDVSFDSAFHADYDTSIYDTCLTDDISRCYTWESLGLGPGLTMKPFLLHAGPQVYDRWMRYMDQVMKTAFPTMWIPDRHEIPQSQLVNELLNVLIAVPSVNFMMDLTDQCFLLREGLHVTGMSSEGLAGLCEEFLSCGMHYHRLSVFSQPLQLDSFYTAGLTFQAFTDGIQQVLQYYRGVVLSLDPAKTVLQLRVALHKLFNEMRFLASLCHCIDPVTNNTKERFPKGIELLSYLYNASMEASFTDHYPLMLSLLKHACTPYLIFVQEWVFHGMYRDAYGEFLIQVNDHYLQYKDKHYWTSGYTLATERIEDSVPMFLRDLATDIFICGKSINLLKACHREHFLCDIDDVHIPVIRLTFSEKELRIMKDQTSMYASRMQQIARQSTLSRAERRERVEQAKRDLITIARQTTARELKQLEDQLAKKRKAVTAKKKIELDFLKQQMEGDLKRRADEHVAKKQADRDYMDGVVNRELALDEHELELERQAREEIIAHYSVLSEEAAHREQKALWRVRRARLDIVRTAFLQQEEEALADEMEKYRHDPSSVPTQALPIVRSASATPILPQWVEHGLHGDTVHVGGGEEADGEQAPEIEGGSSTLPTWARKGLEKYGIKSPSPSKEANARPLSPSPRKKTPTRRSLNSSFHVSDETEESLQKPAIQTFQHMHATTETSTEVSKASVRTVEDRHASRESEAESEARPGVKAVGNQHISLQTQEDTARPHIRSYEDRHANKRSDEPEPDIAPKLKLGVMHSSTESKPMEWKVKKQNVFGHVSQISDSYEFKMPKLKKSTQFSASRESEWSTDFCIKPKIRINKLQTANTQSEDGETERRRAIKMSDRMSATKESEYIDHEKKRVQMFKERNVFGHATDSTVQRLLYEGKFGRSLNNEDEEGGNIRIVPPLEEIEWLTSEVEPYQDDFTCLDKPIKADLLSSLPGVQYGRYSNYPGNHGDTTGYEYLPLTAVMQSSVRAALEAQVLLVNRSLVEYFLADLRIEDHFLALRRYLCMADGDFSEILCDLLMEKLGTNPRPRDLINPMFLNNCLNKAVRLSVNADDKYADNLSFLHKYVPRVFEQTSPELFDCIQLHYEVAWPMNIVITKNSLHKYSQVFSFMLQLKRVVWILKDVWHRLKRDALIHRLDQLYEFRELHLFRQEMQLFVKVMQEYISHQIVDVTWQEFQTALASEIRSLDDLHEAHNTYLNNALFRCLLTKNAASLMKIIQDTFCLILKFHRLLVMGGWESGRDGVQTHQNYAHLKHTYRSFHERSVFLFKVVSKLADRGYEPHLHDLLLRLNFNHYYDR
ncbi:gamma-tubulin complex component 6-like [Mya arenaria]|uniref:gamma-tubulin complex component 6-like n=1 Tax=Mya arenaria TaxID=6604 RepID=UPI0022E8F3D6|nr:gamma-tubulin complex component 6-like [Mya arenaria]